MDDTILIKLADEYGTPLYVYDGDMIVDKYSSFHAAFADRLPKVKVCYALKANSNLAIVSLLAREGAGADCVSGGELATAARAGIPTDGILFTSNSKTDEELREALLAGGVITLGNVMELEVLAEIAQREGKTARVAFRVNPDVSPNTHPKIATGLRDTKFGVHFEDDIAYNAYKRAAELSGVDVVGLHCHIGSQITDFSAFVEAAEKMMDFAARLKGELGVELAFINLGGGLGISYTEEPVPGPDEFAEAVCPSILTGLERLKYEPEMWFEPGRYIVCEAGVLLASVNSVKETPAKKFANVDAGFNTLARPAMYDAFHRIHLVGKKGEDETYDIAGNICESGDILAKERMLPKIERGDVLAIHDAGAYGYSMASTYNSRPLPAEVLVRRGKAELIRERGTLEDLFRGQKIPGDLK